MSGEYACFRCSGLGAVPTGNGENSGYPTEVMCGRCEGCGTEPNPFEEPELERSLPPPRTTRITPELAKLRASRGGA